MRSSANCGAVGVTLFVDGKATTRAATGGLVYEVDHYQYDISDGPCRATTVDSEVIDVDAMST